jgi:hypothetical protein
MGDFEHAIDMLSSFPAGATFIFTFLFFVFFPDFFSGVSKVAAS